MPGLTTKLQLPYPVLGDTVRSWVATFKALADKLEGSSTTSGFTPGTGCTLANTTATIRSGWVHVTVTINVNTGAATINNGGILATIPAGYRLPAGLPDEYSSGGDVLGGTPKLISVRTDGTIRAVQPHTAGSGIIVALSYPSA